MKGNGESWGRYAAKVLLVGLVTMAAAFVGNRLAGADPGGRTREALSVSGTIRGVSGPQRLTFTFRKPGATEVCEGAVEGVTPDGSGHFRAEIPIDGGACPGFFDGANVTVDVRVGANLIVSGRDVNPVPYAKYADQAGGLADGDCPTGFSRDRSATGITLCVRRRADNTVYDEMVKVGAGASAFWIDRYEASVWERANGGPMMGNQWFEIAGDFDPGLPPNGQWTREAYALSQSGVRPAVHITWFQAMEACRASGKALPGRIEWLTSARGTDDPSSPSDGSGGRCRTAAGSLGNVARDAGQGRACASRWGAQDMIGNVDEWTDEWYAGAGLGQMHGPTPAENPTLLNPAATPWPPDFNGDGTGNVNSSVYNWGGNHTGVPAAATRGGEWSMGTRAGMYFQGLAIAPTFSGLALGFRCVIRR